MEKEKNFKLFYWIWLRENFLWFNWHGVMNDFFKDYFCKGYVFYNGWWAVLV